MKPVDIELYEQVPEGTKKVTFAKDQPEYMPLPSLRTPDGRVCSRWKLEPNDLLLVQNGVDIYLTLYTFNDPLQPIMLTVGPSDLGRGKSSHHELFNTAKQGTL